jgi:hypothetical protein
LVFGLVETLASGNPDAEKLLCRAWGCWNPSIVEGTYMGFLRGPAGPEQLSNDLKQLVSQDPASGYRWCDLGESLAAGGDEKTAAYCVERAVTLCPNSALVLLRAANVKLRLGTDTEALPLLGRVLKLTSEFDHIVFSTFERFGGGTDAALTLGLPAERRAGQAFLHYLIANKRAPAEVRKTWDWLSAHRLIDYSASVDYVNYLIASRQFDEAASVWLRSVGSNRGDYLQPNRVFNGDFELDPSGAVLDWQVSMIEGVQVTWAKGESHSGSRALRLDFDAQQNITFNHVSQEVVVEPGRYVFEAFVKSDHITTDQGVEFHIFDGEASNRLDIAITPVLGTTGWTRQAIAFSVPPQTRLIRIELRRESSRKFDNKIKGTLWVDSVKLYPGS